MHLLPGRFVLCFDVVWSCLRLYFIARRVCLGVLSLSGFVLSNLVLSQLVLSLSSLVFVFVLVLVLVLVLVMP